MLYAADNNGINDIAFYIGDIPIAWYGIIIFIGFVLAGIACFCKAHFWYKIPIEPIFYFCFFAIPLSIFGSRFWSAVIGDTEWKYFFSIFDPNAPLEQKGGLAIHGGILFTFVAALIFFPWILKKPHYNVKTILEGKENVKRISSFVYADCMLPCILIGQLIGRWGNFVNGEVYGAVATPEELAWLKNFMPIVYKGMHINGVLHQPLFLYESFVNFWVFLFLFLAMEFISFRKAGDIGALYFVGYGLVRAIMEPLRFSDFEFITSLITAIIMILFGILFILYNHLYLCKNRDKLILYTIYKFSQIPFKKIKYHFSTSYKDQIDKFDKDWKNWGNPKPLVITRKPEEFLYYNGV